MSAESAIDSLKYLFEQALAEREDPAFQRKAFVREAAMRALAAHIQGNIAAHNYLGTCEELAGGSVKAATALWEALQEAEKK